jgi:hypothetical protein
MTIGVTKHDVQRHVSKLDQRLKELTPKQYRKELFVSEETLKAQLDILLHTAKRCGFVLTVELVSNKPLAMGNYKMVGSVRETREEYSK